MRSNLTTKRGDSGSAGLPEEKRVIIEAPNLVSKSDQNKCTTWKSDKKWSKSAKHKNQQNQKNRKSDKTQKSTKSKINKMLKS